jgi:hypothetical protein
MGRWRPHLIQRSASSPDHTRNEHVGSNYIQNFSVRAIGKMFLSSLIGAIRRLYLEYYFVGERESRLLC